MSAIIEGRDITKIYSGSSSFFAPKTDEVRALDGVSVSVSEGQAHAIVGESGCGKTTLAKVLLGLEAPSSGQVLFHGKDFKKLGGSELAKARATLSVVFQDPFSSLNPRMTVEELITEPLRIHNSGKGNGERKARAAELLQKVGLETGHCSRFPHEFSGGQRQRIAIARALALSPKLVVADEPVSALDVSVQAQILNLMKELKEQMNLSYLFITHDFSLVRFLCGTVSVMYLGRIVESGPTGKVLENPQHPYTEALLSAIPLADPKAFRDGIPARTDSAEIPFAELLSKGCRFRDRCPYAQPQCGAADPQLMETEEGHMAACKIRPFAEKPSAAALTRAAA